MLPVSRPPLIAGVVVGCIAIGLLLSILLFHLRRHYQYQVLARKRATLPQREPKPKLSLGMLLLLQCSTWHALTPRRLLRLLPASASQAGDIQPNILLPRQGPAVSKDTRLAQTSAQATVTTRPKPESRLRWCSNTSCTGSKGRLSQQYNLPNTALGMLFTLCLLGAQQ
jgi:hypothetical protein